MSPRMLHLFRQFDLACLEDLKKMQHVRRWDIAKQPNIGNATVDMFYALMDDQGLMNSKGVAHPHAPKSFRPDKDVRDYIKAYADEQGVSQSNAINTLIRYGYEHRLELSPLQRYNATTIALAIAEKEDA